LRVWILKQQSDFCRTQIRLKGDTGRWYDCLIPVKLKSKAGLCCMD
jgi:hypothetical protein